MGSTFSVVVVVPVAVGVAGVAWFVDEGLARIVVDDTGVVDVVSSIVKTPPVVVADVVVGGAVVKGSTGISQPK